MDMPSTKIDIGFREGKKEFKFVKELKHFLHCFTGLKREMALYQISCFEALKDNNIP